MYVRIFTIPHTFQRYDTCGDWQIEGAEPVAIYITVSDTQNEKEAFLLAIHELIEAGLCYFAGVTSQQVDDFDLHWTPHDGITEPGDDPAAPYAIQHALAERIEYKLAEALEVNWQEYENHLNALEYPHD